MVQTKLSNKIQVVIADDHPIFRKGVISLFESGVNIQVVGEANNGQELLTLIRVKRPQVVLLDLDMPVMNGNEALVEIKKSFPDVKIIIISAHFSPELLNYYKNKGVASYIKKESVAEVLLDAIHSVGNNKSYFDNFEKSFSSNSKSSCAGKFLLTNREKEIIQLICLGMSDREISEKLILSLYTIKDYRKSIYEKTQINKVPLLTIFAARYGLISVHGNAWMEL